MITVIVPVYNTQRWLERCINSILIQTYTDFELLAVDDGSTDESLAILEQMARMDSRIRVIHKENGGSSSARNRALDEAVGEYISFIDSDDYIEPDMLGTLMGPVEQARTKMLPLPNIIQVGRNEIDEDSKLRPDICVPPVHRTDYTAEEFMRELLLHKGDCSFCTKLVKREMFDGIRFPEGMLNEDFWLLTNILEKAGGVVSLPGYKYHVFYRTGSNTRTTDKNSFSRVYADNVTNADKVLRLVDNKYPNLHKIAVRFGIFQRIDYMLHIPISKMKEENIGYMEVKLSLRSNLGAGLKSRYLTGKDKRRLFLLAIAPKLTRIVHAFTMKIRGI